MNFKTSYKCINTIKLIAQKLFELMEGFRKEFIGRQIFFFNNLF